MIPGISTGGGGLSASSGVRSSNELSQGGHVFNFGPPAKSGVQGINYNMLALAAVAGVILFVAVNR
ncbi:hypothetical protein [Marinobacter salarius]|uniref:hypothetical protein n=1 Tax=Marinobacter salarius TaxID=1420917 RepID=UPI003D0B7483